MQAAGGFDGIVRDLAGYDDEIPIIGVKNPLGGINDAVARPGRRRRQRRPARARRGVLRGQGVPRGLRRRRRRHRHRRRRHQGPASTAPAWSRSQTSGENKGDVEFTVQHRRRGERQHHRRARSAPSAQGKVGLTATISLDAQNGYKPDKLDAQGQRAATPARWAPTLLARGRQLKDISEALEKVSLSANQGVGKGFEVSGELDLKDPENLDGDARRAGRPERECPLAEALNDNGKLGFDTYNLTPRRPRARSRSASASAAAAAAPPAPRSRATGRATFARPGVHSPRASASSPPDEAAHPPFRPRPLPRRAAGCGGGGERLQRGRQGARRLQDVRGLRRLASPTRPTGRSSDGTSDDGGPVVEITPPDKAKTPYGLIQLQRDAEGGRPLQEPRRPAPHRDHATSTTARSTPTRRSRSPAPSRRCALTATTPPGQGSDPSRSRPTRLDVLRDNDDMVVLTAASPQRDGPDVRPGPSSTRSG